MLQGLLQAAGAALHAADGFRQQAQIALFIDQTAAHQAQVVVIGSDALKGPQQTGVAFLVQIIGRERRRLHPLDVPTVEVFVADQTQQFQIAVADLLNALLRQIVAVGHQRGGSAMLQTAVDVFADEKHEHIALERSRLAKQFDLVFANFLGVARQALEVGAETTGDNEFVRYAAGFEADSLEGAQLHRMVDQLVVGSRLIAAEAGFLVRAARRQTGRHFPIGVGLAFRRQDLHRAGLVFIAVHRQENAAAVIEAALRVQIRSAHGQIKRINFIAQNQHALDRRGLPAVFCQLDQLHRFSRGFRANFHNMPGELPDHVTTGNPSRQGENLAVLCGFGNGQDDLEKMRLRGAGT